MISLSELSQYLNRFLSVSLFQDYCPNGIQVEGKQEIKTIATAVSASLATLEEAALRKVDALIVHHGLFWQGDPLPITGIKKKRLECLLKNNISLLAFHLPLDAHPIVGNNWKVARDFGWQELEPFGNYNGTKIGVKGKFSPISLDDFTKKIESYYGHRATIASGGKDIITSGALVSGGAYKEIKQAICEKVDCFITGNFDEPAWDLAFEEKIHFFALGHTATEKIGPKALLAHLVDTFTLNGTFIDTTNPF